MSSTLKDVQKENSALKQQVKQGKSKITDLEKSYKALLAEVEQIKASQPSGTGSNAKDSATAPTQEALDNVLEKASTATQDLVSLKNDWETLETAVEGNSIEIGNLAQYLRVNSLLIHGLRDVPSCNGYDFAIYIVEKINQLLGRFLRFSVNIWNLEYAHILPTRNKIKTVVVVKFKSRFMKYDIFENRFNLKGTGVSITEHLTPNNSNLLRQARQVIGFVNVWTSHNKILANLEGSVYTIASSKDITALKQKCDELFPDGLPDDYKAQRKEKRSNNSNRDRRSERDQNRQTGSYQNNVGGSYQGQHSNESMSYSQPPRSGPYQNNCQRGDFDYNDRSDTGYPNLGHASHNQRYK